MHAYIHAYTQNIKNIIHTYIHTHTHTYTDMHRHLAISSGEVLVAYCEREPPCSA
jgi:hypothetical protein